MDIVVWFSCGAASAVAAKKTIEKYPCARVRVVNNPVPEEHPDNRRFLADVERWLGVKIETAINPEFSSCDEVWRKRRFLSGIAGAPCTYELKKKARQIWERENSHDYLVLGFTAEEEARHNRFKMSERDNILPILIEEGITKAECYQIIRNAGIELPEIYRMGFPNANCIGCVKATSPTYWNLVRRTFPDVFLARADLCDELGARLVRVKNKRIPLSELDERAVGRPLKNMDFECGIFCEERTG